MPININTETHILSHQQISQMLEAMPPFPESVSQIIKMSSDINCAPKDLVKVIESDPLLTIKILKMVNSAFFALSRHVASVQQALVYIGMNTIKNMAITIASIEAIPRHHIPQFSTTDFLTHALTTAVASQNLAKCYLHIKDTSDFFVAGLLHDFGKIILLEYQPESYVSILRQAASDTSSLSHLEIQQIGISHTEVGAQLADYWQLPAALVQCIRTHLACNRESSDLTISVAAARILAINIESGETNPEDAAPLPGFICQRLGCDAASCILHMRDLHEEVEAIQQMVKG